MFYLSKLTMKALKTNNMMQLNRGSIIIILVTVEAIVNTPFILVYIIIYR